MSDNAQGGSRHDAVDHPSHYTSYDGFEVIDITEQLNFNIGNVVKYALRAGKKDDAVQDLRKAAWYATREADRLQKLLDSQDDMP